jgi:hypothetical protein
MRVTLVSGIKRFVRKCSLGANVLRCGCDSVQVDLLGGVGLTKEQTTGKAVVVVVVVVHFIFTLSAAVLQSVFMLHVGI